VHTIAPRPRTALEAAVALRAADHGKPQKIESLRFAKTTLFTVDGRKAAEPD
jgi:hypothetical protein